MVREILAAIHQRERAAPARTTHDAVGVRLHLPDGPPVHGLRQGPAKFRALFPRGADVQVPEGPELHHAPAPAQDGDDAEVRGGRRSQRPAGARAPACRQEHFLRAAQRRQQAVLLRSRRADHQRRHSAAAAGGTAAAVGPALCRRGRQQGLRREASGGAGGAARRARRRHLGRGAATLRWRPDPPPARAHRGDQGRLRTHAAAHLAPQPPGRHHQPGGAAGPALDRPRGGGVPPRRPPRPLRARGPRARRHPDEGARGRGRRP
mmetsp:Transcript_6102/g.17226  ORF Transcript_6102/g.17226 Transcript_6102/m.17226 type:complete len:264 (-) Transcript_6102:464-1255(-)